MTIAFGSIGAKSAGGTTSISIPYPSSPAADDLLIAGRCVYQVAGSVADNQSGWTPAGDLHGGANLSADDHTSRVRGDYKVATGSESGSLSFSQSGTTPNGALGVMARYTKSGAGAWDVIATTRNDNTHAADRSFAGSVSMDLAAGDWLVAVVAVDTDAALTITSPTFTASGITFGTVTRRTSGAGVGTGNDGNVELFDIPITAGSGTVTVDFAFTTATSQCGPASFIRIRETVPQVAADQAGSGAFSAVVVPVIAVAAALAGSGAFSASVVEVEQTAANLTGSGAFSASAFPLHDRDAALAGSGAFSAVVETDTAVNANLTGSGAFSADVVAVEYAAADLTGSGALSASVVPVIAVAGGFTGSGAFSAVIEAGVIAALTGSGAFSADIEVFVTPHTQTDNRAGGRTRSGLGITAFDPPLEPVPAAMVLGASYPIAQAFSGTTMVGNQAHFTVDTERGTQTRLQILYGNRDVTFLFGLPTPRPDFQRATPFDFGPSTLRFPQFANPHEKAGVGRWSFLRLGKPVRYRVIDVVTDEVLKVLYRGVHTGYDPDSGTLSLQIGGQATGRMALRDQQAPLFTSRTDVLNLMRRVFQSINIPFDDDRAPTGIELGRFGDTGMLDYAQQVLARSWSRSGSQLTVMPNAEGKYRLFRRDTETIHGTIYLDDARTPGSLHRDLSEEPNRIYGGGTTTEGKRILNGVYPGLVKIDPVPPYPMDDGSSFGLGTLSSETDHGFLAMLARLQTLGLLNRNDADETDGEYTQDVMDAMSEVQEQAGILGIEGNMTEASWDALFNVGVTGYNVWWSKRDPMASARGTRRVKRTPDGAILGPNPDYDPQLLVRDRTLDFGAGFEVRQMHEFARAELDAANDPNWVGTVTLGLGAICRGDHTWGDPIDPMADWELDPGQNYKVVNSAGGELIIHASGLTYGEGPLQITGDTRFRDAQPAWEVIRRSKESRGDLNRKADRQRRASTETKDVLTPMEEYGGRIDPVPVGAETWTHFEVVMGKAGQVNETRIRTRGAVGDAETDVAQPTRFVLCISGIEIPRAFLAANVPDPLNDKSPWFDEDFQQRLRDEFRMWYIIGEPGALGGYSPKVQSMDGATITGKWHDKSPWPFETGVQPIGHVSIFAEDATIVAGGRIIWNQEIVGS